MYNVDLAPTRCWLSGACSQSWSTLSEAALPKERRFVFQDPMTLSVPHQLGSGRHKRCERVWLLMAWVAKVKTGKVNSFWSEASETAQSPLQTTASHDLLELDSTATNWLLHYI